MRFFLPEPLGTISEAVRPALFLASTTRWRSFCSRKRESRALYFSTIGMRRKGRCSRSQFSRKRDQVGSIQSLRLTKTMKVGGTVSAWVM